MKIKNLFLGALALTGALFVTSCSQDELVEAGVSAGNLVTASFTIETPEGISTRAIGDGTTADVVKCVVYDEKGAHMSELDQTLKIVDKHATYDIRLVKGQGYRVAFFAYNETANAYDVTDMKNILVNPNQPCNIEGRDAFTANIDVTAVEIANGPISKTVTLYRPFAQLNLGAYADDVEAARKAGVVVTNSQITVSDVYTAFSAYDDAVVGKTSTMTFAMNGIPTEVLKADVDGDKKDEDYTYLALNYLLVGDKDAEKALTNIEFVWETADGKTNNPTAKFENVPVERNHRTNILGWLLTNPAQFNVVVDEEFKKPDYNVIDGYVIKNAAQGDFVVALNNSEVKNITVNAPMDFDTDAIKVTSNKVIDMNGNEIVAGGVDSKNYAFEVYGNYTLELIDANIQNGGVGATDGAEVIFHSGSNHVNNTGTSRYVFYAGTNTKITIKDGEFSVNKPKNRYICAYENSEVYVEGGTWGTNGIVPSSPFYVGKNSKIVITGGKFNVDPSAYVPAGYEVVNDGTWYIVEKGVEFVDLGLSVLWADRNVKAKSATEIGQYYSWADTVDPTPEADDGDISWNWNNYDYYIGDDNDNLTTLAEITKYTAADGLVRIQPEDDIATKLYGAGCSIPTMEQIEELLTCDWVWDADKKGCTVTGPNGNQIFIPAGGYKYNTNMYNSLGVYCCIWSSDIDPNELLQAKHLESNMAGKQTNTSGRFLGLPIRAVKTK